MCQVWGGLPPNLSVQELPMSPLTSLSPKRLFPASILHPPPHISHQNRALISITWLDDLDGGWEYREPFKAMRIILLNADTGQNMLLNK